MRILAAEKKPSSVSEKPEHKIRYSAYILDQTPKPYMKKFLTAVLMLTVSGLYAQQGWTPEVMIKLKRVGGTDISRDGKLVAYTIATPMMDGDNSEFRSQVWVASTDGKWNTQFTQSERSCVNPRFSPDGQFLAFTSTRGADGKSQIWMMRIGGGEAEMITKSKTSVGAFEFSPDGKRIAFISEDAYPEDVEKSRKEKMDWNVVDEFRYNHLYVVDLSTRKIKRLTKGKYDVNQLTWTPDGKMITFAHQKSPMADEWPTTDLSTVPADSGAVKLLYSTKGSDSDPSYSNDGQWLAFVSDGGQTRWAQATDIYVMPAAGGQPKKLAESGDRQPNIIGWSADGKEIYYFETERTSARVFAMPVAGGKPRVITTGAGTFTGSAVSADSKWISFIHQSPEVAPEVFVSSMLKMEPKRLSDANKDFPKYAMGKTEVITWKSKDGKEIEGLLTYPVNYKQGRKYPLILNIHGGPAGVFTQNFTAGGAVYPIQAFAQQGYAVLRPNPRGSSGYGKEFRQANINDWGFGDYDDDQTGVDKLIDLGIAHPDSLVICGWSYGGYMTSFTVTKTNRFKAASLGAPVTNMMSFNGTADIPGFLPDYFDGEFWDRMEAYQKHSAMFNIKSVKTPSQVIHGERDIRVPISQGYEFYTAMKRLGVPTEMVTYPRTPHGPQEPKFIQNIGERVLGWFNKYLGKKNSVVASAR